MKKITLAVADDHQLFRSTLVDNLKNESDFEVLIEAGDGLQLLELLKTNQPSIIVMDISMPKMNGIEASTRVMELYPNIKIIAHSQFDNEANILEMYTRGVKSFIGKDEEPEQLFSAIRIVYGGAIFLTALAGEIIQRNLSLLDSKANLYAQLSDFEKILLHSICNGGSSVQLGNTLNKSPRTIEEHREKLYKKLGVKTKDELLKKVYSQNLL